MGADGQRSEGPPADEKAQNFYLRMEGVDIKITWQPGLT